MTFEVFDVHSVFFNISKSFAKVRRSDIIFKLKQIGISGNLFKLI